MTDAWPYSPGALLAASSHYFGLIFTHRNTDAESHWKEAKFRYRIDALYFEGELAGFFAMSEDIDRIVRMYRLAGFLKVVVADDNSCPHLLFLVPTPAGIHHIKQNELDVEFALIASGKR